MSVTVWRIAVDTRDYEADDLAGAGARMSGGRWNGKGEAVVYASETRALACLETVVHLDAWELPLDRYLVSVEIPEDVWGRARVETAASLPVGWDAEPAGRASVVFGTAWIKSGSCAVLRVASAIVPEEFNVLINPGHFESGRIVAAKVRKWLFDPRLGAR